MIHIDGQNGHKVWDKRGEKSSVNRHRLTPTVPGRVKGLEPSEFWLLVSDCTH